MILESEGAREAALNEGRALAEQVNIIAQSLVGTDGTLTAVDRQNALHSLLDLRRIEQLNAIAQGNANTTYFFGGETGRTPYEVDKVEKLKAAWAATTVDEAGGR